MLAVITATVLGLSVNISRIADDTDEAPGGGGRLVQLTFPRVSGEKDCYFQVAYGDRGMQQMVMKQTAPDAKYASLQVVAETGMMIGEIEVDNLLLESGSGECFIADTSTDQTGIYCRNPQGVVTPIATNQSSPFSNFVSAIDWGQHVVFNGVSENQGYQAGIFLASRGSISNSYNPLASCKNTPFSRNASAFLNFFGTPEVVRSASSSPPLVTAFFASHHTDVNGEYINVHAGVFIWTAEIGLRLLLEDHVSPVPSSPHLNNKFWGFSDVCTGSSSRGGLYVAFVGIGTKGGKGVYVHYVEAGKTVRLADTNQRSPSGDPFEDFPFNPSCSNNFVSFYGDAGDSTDSTRSSGLYLVLLQGPKVKKVSIQTVLVKSQGIGGATLLAAPQASGGSLSVPLNTIRASAKMCFFAQFTNGTYGVFSASITL
eukprot:TRINITY_DN5378_c0_g2_i1.p1 TRINITY_DN5378_c0_g2~~TRINITY_DN5378_c0_g2_i1.p1  ORF type:complete len:448 (+),score=54.52 TRINITY_DN5378_c0_g2_i1:63-1346(+)